MSRQAVHFTYWLHSDHGTDPDRHGYVGVTRHLLRRIYWHFHRGLPAFKVEILLRGTKEQCLALEKKLRPTSNIGWNKNIGGTHPGSVGKGKPKTPEHRAKMKAAALKRYQDPDQHELTSVFVKKGLPKNHSKGKNNPRYGKKMSEASKAKMRATIAASGGRSGDRNPNYKG